jgi:DNA invertase Pin-like site-specific DNA recombinase
MSKERPKRAIGYGRVSTKQQEDGLDTQVFGITKLCENEGIELIGPNFADTGFWENHPIPKKELEKAINYPTVWCDFGVSGGHIDRPMFNAVLAYMKQEDIKDLIMYDTSRLSRNLVDAVNFVEEHIRGPLGITVHFVTMPDLNFDDPNHEMMFRMKSMMDDMERKQVKIKVSTAMNRLQEQEHEWVGRTPFGLYASRKGDSRGEKGKLYYYQQELEIIVEALREYNKINSYSGVATYLNNRGLTTRSGGAWYPQQVKRIVEHSVMDGELNGDHMFRFFPKDMQWSEE